MKKEEEQKKKEGQKKTAEQKQKEKQEQMKRKAEEKIAQQEAMKDPDRTFFSKSERIGTLILDILKLTVVFSLSLLITAIPWFVGKEDGPLPTYKFNDVNETNLCYWFGDTGLLDVKIHANIAAIPQEIAREVSVSHGKTSWKGIHPSMML